MLAVTKASLRSIFRSPSAIVFSIGFPLIFIVVFGFIGGNGRLSLSVAINKNADTLNPVYGLVKNVPGLKIVNKTETEIAQDLAKGRIVAVIDIQKNALATPAYLVTLKSSEAVNPQNLQILSSLLNSINAPTVASISKDIQKVPGRVYRTIDFILPGQLGFSLLSAGIFGVAFLFFNLRQQLVLKRFFATPISRTHIILGECLSRVIFQMFTAVIIIGVGTFAFHFTLVNGVVTFLEIMVLSFIALVVFMGFGFVVTSMAKSESTIPPLANLFTMPQFLLAGTFFPIDAFPSWLQPICRVLPLTHFNNAMRLIAFEGASLVSCWKEIGVLCLWGVGVYIVAVKVFKWE